MPKDVRPLVPLPAGDFPIQRWVLLRTDHAPDRGPAPPGPILRVGERSERGNAEPDTPSRHQSQIENRQSKIPELHNLVPGDQNIVVKDFMKIRETPETRRAVEIGRLVLEHDCPLRRLRLGNFPYLTPRNRLTAVDR